MCPSTRSTKFFQKISQKNLANLYLNNNSITEFNENTLKYLTETFKPNSIQLGHNPYSCECLKSTIFLDYLNSGLKSKIRDTKDIFFSCSPPLISTDLMEEMCHATASIYGTSLLFSILVVCLLALVLTKKNYLRQRFYSLPWVLQRFPEDWSLHYDVFISYSDHDRDFVENVLWHHLENESYACCVHTRDFVVGDAISDQILKAVDQSRRTIIVLSPEYAASDWTKLEFQAAHTKAISNRRQRLVIVVPPGKDLPPLNEVDEDLRAYCATALKAEDPKFWSTLRDTLPSRGEEMGRIDNTEEKSEKATQGTRMTDMIDRNTESARHMA